MFPESSSATHEGRFNLAKIADAPSPVDPAVPVPAIVEIF
jgi:hypothetical protein